MPVTVPFTHRKTRERLLAPGGLAGEHAPHLHVRKTSKGVRKTQGVSTKPVIQSYLTSELGGRGRLIRPIDLYLYMEPVSGEHRHASQPTQCVATTILEQSRRPAGQDKHQGCGYKCCCRKFKGAVSTVEMIHLWGRAIVVLLKPTGRSK